MISTLASLFCFQVELLAVLFPGLPVARVRSLHAVVGITLTVIEFVAPAALVVHGVYVTADEVVFVSGGLDILRMRFQRRCFLHNCIYVAVNVAAVTRSFWSSGDSAFYQRLVGLFAASPQVK
jgi:hypothetical protein